MSLFIISSGAYEHVILVLSCPGISVGERVDDGTDKVSGCDGAVCVPHHLYCFLGFFCVESETALQKATV